MNTANSSLAMSYLDKIRYKDGIDKLKTFFHDVGANDKDKAISLINNKMVRFCTLFVLMPEIENLNLYDNLSERNNVAIKICNEISSNKSIESLVNEYGEIIPNVLKWMLKTGAVDDELFDDFDEVLDLAASLLINKYKDNSILPVLADMIFKRNRGGYLINDLVWVFFQARDPQTIKIIAQYLRSPYKKDFELASKLLNLDKEKLINNKYSNLLAKLKEDLPYIFFTGQSYLFTSDPKPYDVDLEAKYLCRNAAQSNKTYTDEENNYIETFKKADYNSKVLLSEYSNKIYNKDIDFWKKWINKPLEEQINIAKTRLGVRS